MVEVDVQFLTMYMYQCEYEGRINMPELDNHREEDAGFR